MNFNQAILELSSGKKIRRICWLDGHYWELCDMNYIVDSAFNVPRVNKSQILADDWEVVEEKKKRDIIQDRIKVKDIIMNNIGFIASETKVQEIADCIVAELNGMLDEKDGI